MDNPVFKLEGVVHERSAETLQDFEGPLDLILFLLSKNKIEIQDIQISAILEQYLAYLERRKEGNLELGNLPRGQVRLLKEEEIRELEALCGM